MPHTDLRPPAPDAVPRITLAPGLSIARVLTGLWQVADMERGGRELDPEHSAAAMERYVASGLTTFDMADHYGSAEVIAGHYRATRGEAAPAETLTKWVPKPGPVTRAEARQAVERSLTRLRTERLELLQFHTWTYDDPVWLDTLGYLDELRQEGLIGQLGLTNVDTAHLRLAVASGIPIVTNQVSFSLLDRRAAHGMTAWCREHGVHVLAYGTLSGGLLTERWLGVPEPEWGESTPWSINKYRRFVEVAGGWDAYQNLLAAAAAVAARHGTSLANVATRFVLDEPGVGGVIVGARLGEREHIDDTVRLFDLSLDARDRGELEAAIAALAPLPGDCGDEYRKPPFLTASGDLSDHLQTLPAPFETRTLPDGRQVVQTGTAWERDAGYARAVRVGSRILVSGTTARHGARLLGGDDAASQAEFAFDKIEGTLRSLGASLEHVVRTRVYVAHDEDVEAVARVHGRRMGQVLPANTLVGARLADPGERVEIEAEAWVP